MVLEVLPHAGLQGSLSYLLTDPRTKCCAVVDPLPDTAEALACGITSNNLICEWVLSTGDALEGGSTARSFADRFLCPRTAGPAGRDTVDAPHPFDVTFEDDQRLTIGHANGRVWVGEGCASYIFDGLIVAGCPVGVMSTAGRVDTLKRLGDECCVMLHKPLDPAHPYAGYRSSLGELKQLGAIIG